MTDVFEPLVALEAYFAGEIDPEEAVRLRAWIEADPQRLADVAERAKIHSYLTMTGVRRLTENVLLAALESQPQVGRVTRHPSAVGTRRRWLAVSGVALAIGLVAVAAFYLFPREDDQEKVATIVTVDDVVWRTKPLEVGMTIARGEIHIESGRLEVMMASSAEMNIMGAARLDIVDAKAVRLHRGAANLYCPAEAHGFMVALPGKAEVVDLGTDFDVQVAADGMSQITVNEGRVEVRAPDEAAVEVTAGNQVSVAAAGEQRIGAVALVNRANAWKRQLQQFSTDKRAFLLLPLDGNANAAVPAMPANVAGVPTPAIDRFGNTEGALHFDGQNSYAVFPLTWPQGDFTLSVWVRTAEPGIGRYIIASESKEEPLASRRLRLIGDVVKADVFVHSMHRIFVNDVRARGGSGPISQDRWTHVVATFRRLTGDEAQMKIYIDGQQTSDNRYAYREGADPIAAGITVGNSPLAPAPQRCFHGDLDDVLLLKAVLSDEEVLALYESSRPDPHPPVAN